MDRQLSTTSFAQCQNVYLRPWRMLKFVMDFAWQSFDDPEPGSDLQGVVGFLHPDRYRTVPRVFWNSRRIESQLAESDGLIGYALRAEPFGRRFWAVALWETDEHLQGFVETDPHKGIRAALKGAMAESWFERFAADTEDVPMSVDEALARVR